jgi:hypothetical protein
VIADLPDLETVVVVRSAGAGCAMRPGRDLWFDDLIARADPVTTLRDPSALAQLQRNACRPPRDAR